jgi:hypothetical protein
MPTGYWRNVQKGRNFFGYAKIETGKFNRRNLQALLHQQLGQQCLTATVALRHKIVLNGRRSQTFVTVATPRARNSSTMCLNCKLSPASSLISFEFKQLVKTAALLTEALHGALERDAPRAKVVLA